MEGASKEEVFLGAFQFQPENIIQTFQLQVPEKSCPTEHLVNAHCVPGFTQGTPLHLPTVPGGAQLSLTRLTEEETEAQRRDPLPRKRVGP